MKRIALSGADGQLGSLLRRALPALGFQLRSAGFQPLPEPGPTEDVVAGNLADPYVVDQLLHGVDALVHLAGSSVERPLDEIMVNNLQALHQVYEGARRHGVRRVVFASSNHAVGMHAMEQALETDCDFRPDGLYGLSKMWGEGMGRLYWDKHGIETVCIRIGSCLPRPTELRHLSTWLGHEDFIHLVQQALTAPALGFLVAWGVSANSRSPWSNAKAARLGYQPRQNAEDFAAALAGVDPRDAIARQFQGGSFASHDYTPR